jgi:hypothetical protein
MKMLHLFLMALVLTASACANKPGAAGESTPAAAAAPEASPDEKPKKPSPPELLGCTKNFLPKKQKPPAAVPPRLLGQIRQVNSESGFVLIDATVSSAVEPGDVLICIANQQEKAELKLTSLSSASFVIADITSGEPSVGDRVYKR